MSGLISKNIGDIKANDGTGEKTWNVVVTFHPDKAGPKNRPFCKVFGRAIKKGKASVIGGCLTVEVWDITPIKTQEPSVSVGMSCRCGMVEQCGPNNCDFSGATP